MEISAGNSKQFGEEVAKLIVTAPDKPAIVIELPNLLTIGRSPTNQLVVDDQNASRMHAEIRLIAGGRYCLFDVGSSNGTWLNGRRITAPQNLVDGDQITIGDVHVHFKASGVAGTNDASLNSGTALLMRNELVIVLVADIRNYTTMSEVLPSVEFSRTISDWFRKASDIIEKNGGMVDKFIGDAVMAFWVVAARSDPGRETDAALDSAQDLIACAEAFSREFSIHFPGYLFRIGVGLNMGEALLGNVGTGKNQSFTVVGDSVNVAFRLEALSKEKGAAIIVGCSIMEHARKTYDFENLGFVEVKGRVESVPVYALVSR
jgi:class 3 adenylate cyclase